MRRSEKEGSPHHGDGERENARTHRVERARRVHDALELVQHGARHQRLAVHVVRRQCRVVSRRRQTRRLTRQLPPGHHGAAHFGRRTVHRRPVVLLRALRLLCFFFSRFPFDGQTTVFELYGLKREP